MGTPASGSRRAPDTTADPSTRAEVLGRDDKFERGRTRELRLRSGRIPPVGLRPSVGMTNSRGVGRGLRLRSVENQVMRLVEAPDFSPATTGTGKPGFSPGQHERNISRL